MKLIQTQEQKQQQLQRLTQQQMLQVHMLEMPVTELEENVNAELDDNPALVKADDDIYDSNTSYDSQESPAYASSSDNDGGNGESNGGDMDEVDTEADAFAAHTEREERESALNNALDRMTGSDEDMPTAAYTGAYGADSADYEEMVYGDTRSFYDKLKEQMGEIDLSENDQKIMEYIIGSLDSDGLLRKDSQSICDELAIYQGVYCDVEDIDRIIGILQTFDPAGIGAHSLQECLLLQIERRPDDRMKQLMTTVVKKHFNDFAKKHFEKLPQLLGVDEHTGQRVLEELRRLNPKPGASLGETEGRNVQQITPDFIIDTDDNGNVSFYINNGNIPELRVSSSFSELMETYRNNKEKMSRREKEALLYAKQKVERAMGYIEAIKQRYRTLTLTMQAIIDWQRKFFQDGDEADLKPMILKNIADRTGLDISTISRVSNVKYAQTNWGTYPLRFFFSDGYTNEDGEEMSTRKIKIALKDLVDKENKAKPLSDDAMSCPSQLSMFPRIGCVFRLSTFTRSATSSQYARFAVMIYSVFPSTLIATSVIITARNA